MEANLTQRRLLERQISLWQEQLPSPEEELLQIAAYLDTDNPPLPAFTRHWLPRGLEMLLYIWSADLSGDNLNSGRNEAIARFSPRLAITKLHVVMHVGKAARLEAANIISILGSLYSVRDYPYATADTTSLTIYSQAKLPFPILKTVANGVLEINTTSVRNAEDLAIKLNPDTAEV